MGKNKSSTTILPLRIVQEFTKKYPDAMRLCDTIVSSKGIDVPDWDNQCVIPISATLAVGNEVNNGNGSEIAQAIAAIYAWRKYKEIYSFDEDMVDLLYEQADDTKIPVDALKLPYPCIFIQNSKTSGFFCWIEHDIKDNSFELRFWCVSDDDTSGYPLILHLMKDGTIEDAVNETAHQAVETTKQNKEVFQSMKQLGMKNLEEMEKLFLIGSYSQINKIAKLLQLVLYICAENTQKEENPEQKKITKRSTDSVKKPKDVFREIRKWDVGYRIGSAIRQNKIKYENDNTETQSTVEHKSSSRKRPHTRRGHYHHFWMGSDSDGTRRIVLKWVAPMFINYDEDDNPATIHPVK